MDKRLQQTDQDLIIYSAKICCSLLKNDNIFIYIKKNHKSVFNHFKITNRKLNIDKNQHAAKTFTENKNNLKRNTNVINKVALRIWKYVFIIIILIFLYFM